MSRRTQTTALAGILGLIGWPSGLSLAHADCASPPTRVLWASPADGESGVALDADLLLITEGWPVEEVRADDRLLSPGALPGLYDLGPLEPMTRYTITVAFVHSAAQGGEPAEPVELSFTTGADEATHDPSDVAVTAMTERTLPFDEAIDCEDVLYVNSCFDTGPPVLQSFAVEAEPVLWIIESIRVDDGGHQFQALPADCGPPRQLTWGRDDSNRSYIVHAIGVDGSVVSSDEIEGPFHTPAMPPASTPEQPDAGTGPGPESASGCAVTTIGSHAPSAAIAFWLALLALRRRRVRRARARLRHPA